MCRFSELLDTGRKTADDVAPGKGCLHGRGRQAAIKITESNFQTLSKDETREIISAVENKLPAEERIIGLDRLLAQVDKSLIIPKNVAGLGVSVSWEPFDWGRKKREASEKARSIEQAALALREAENSVQAEVNAKYRKLQQARQMLVVNRMSQESSVEKLRVMGNRYRQQAALLNDVLNAQAAMAEADNQYQQALLAFWSARADFEKAVGGDQ